MKVREDLARDDYGDPGDYAFPQGSVAYEIDAPTAKPARQQKQETQPPKDKGESMKGMKM